MILYSYITQGGYHFKNIRYTISILRSRHLLLAGNDTIKTTERERESKRVWSVLCILIDKHTNNLTYNEHAWALVDAIGDLSSTDINFDAQANWQLYWLMINASTHWETYGKLTKIPLLIFPDHSVILIFSNIILHNLVGIVKIKKFVTSKPPM